MGSYLALSLRGVNKWYGDFHVLKDINLNIRKGERIVICGPSGSGKSNLIRCTNLLEEHQEGIIAVNNVTLTSDLKNIDYVRNGFCPYRGRPGYLMDAGQIVEEAAPEPFFNNPQSDRTKLFLSQILSH